MAGRYSKEAIEMTPRSQSVIPMMINDNSRLLFIFNMHTVKISSTYLNKNVRKFDEIKMDLVLSVSLFYIHNISFSFHIIFVIG